MDDAKIMTYDRIRKLALLVVPGIVCLLGGICLHALAPVYSAPYYWYNLVSADPAYVYLFNGLSILFGVAPGHVDHPGTPVQLFVAFIILVKSTLSGTGTSDAMKEILADPEASIAMLGVFLLAGNALATWFLGVRIMRATGSVALAVGAQTGPMYLGYLLPRLTYLAPEAFLIAIAALLIGVLSGRLFGRDDDPFPTRDAIVAGLLAGLGITAKLTFAPLFGLLLLLGPNRRLALSGLASVIAAAIFLLPIYGSLPVLWKWIWDLASHKGHYGAGEIGLMNWSEVPDHLRYTWTAVPIVYFGLAASVIGFVIATYNHRRFSTRTGNILALLFFAAPMALVFAAQLFIVMKHFLLQYLSPIVPLSTVAIVWLFWLAHARIETARLRRYANGAVAIVLFSAGVWHSAMTLAQVDAASREKDADRSTLDGLLAKYPGSIVVGTYTVPEINFAIHFGLTYTRPDFSNMANEILRNNLSIYGDNLFRPGTGPDTGFFDISRLNDFIAGGQHFLAVFPKTIPFKRLECAEPIVVLRYEHVCSIVKVLPREGSK